jgi:hypothetical protein
VQVALEQLAAFAHRLDKPRAIALFGQLRANDDWFARHGPPKNKTDVTGADGVVYRYFAGQAFEFHPLANFAALNMDVSRKDVAGAEQLADALVARGVRRHGGGTVWEYYFPAQGGRPPWESGMAQAVAAQAFAGAAGLLTDQSDTLLRAAHAAYEAIPGRLTTTVPAGPWIRLYSFSPDPVLNAQLQTVVSLQSYAQAAGDADAAAFATRLEQAAAATVSRFDTGYWSDYSLAGEAASLSYHEFVIQLLRKRGRRSGCTSARAGTRSAGPRRSEPASTRSGSRRSGRPGIVHPSRRCRSSTSPGGGSSSRPAAPRRARTRRAPSPPPSRPVPGSTRPARPRRRARSGSGSSG